MALSPVITQNGNTTVTYSFSGGLMTNHEAVAIQLNATAGNTTGALLSNVTVYINPIHYYCTVTAVGSQAISFQFISNAL